MSVLVDKKICATQIDLLKVDVEGDELAVLEGVSKDDWPRIRQVAVEVHDSLGRLKATVSLLERAGFAVTVEPQKTEQLPGGYLSVVPLGLAMYYVYASRRQ